MAEEQELIFESAWYEDKGKGPLAVVPFVAFYISAKGKARVPCVVTGEVLSDRGDSSGAVGLGTGSSINENDCMAAFEKHKPEIHKKSGEKYLAGIRVKDNYGFGLRGNDGVILLDHIDFQRRG